MRRPNRYILVLLVVAVLVPAGAVASPGLFPKAAGSYHVIVRGACTGDGHAAVGANSMTINARVQDEAGNKGRLVAPNLRVQNGRFSGTGTSMGKSVTLSGRIDAPDGQSLKVARLTCTFATSDGHYGRVVGHRKGP